MAAQAGDHGTAVIEDDPLQRKELDRLKARLIERFSPPVRPEDVERCLHSCIAMFETARVRNYLLLLIERVATERLLAEVQLIDGTQRLQLGRILVSERAIAAASSRLLTSSFR